MPRRPNELSHEVIPSALNWLEKYYSDSGASSDESKLRKVLLWKSTLADLNVSKTIERLEIIKEVNDFVLKNLPNKDGKRLRKTLQTQKRRSSSDSEQANDLKQVVLSTEAINVLDEAIKQNPSLSSRSDVVIELIGKENRVATYERN